MNDIQNRKKPKCHQSLKKINQLEAPEGELGKHYKTKIKYNRDYVVALEGIYDNQEEAEKQAFDNSRLSIVPRNKPCDVGLN